MSINLENRRSSQDTTVFYIVNSLIWQRARINKAAIKWGTADWIFNILSKFSLWLPSAGWLGILAIKLLCNHSAFSLTGKWYMNSSEKLSKNLLWNHSYVLVSAFIQDSYGKKCTCSKLHIKIISICSMLWVISGCFSYLFFMMIKWCKCVWNDLKHWEREASQGSRNSDNDDTLREAHDEGCQWK